MQSAASLPTAPAVSFDRVGKEFSGDWTGRKTQALDDVSLHVRRGSITALVGSNGSGKTTMLKLAARLTAPTRGRCSILGRVGYLPEAPNLPQFMTPRQLLASVLSAEMRRVEGEIDRILEACGLVDAADVVLARLSKGRRQRTALAIALAGSPDILVLDEPTDGLDPRGIRGLFQILETERAAGRTVLLSTHFLPAIEAIADHVVLLEAGRVTFSGGRDAVQQGGGIERIYLESAAR